MVPKNLLLTLQNRAWLKQFSIVVGFTILHAEGNIHPTNLQKKIISLFASKFFRFKRFLFRIKRKKSIRLYNILSGLLYHFLLTMYLRCFMLNVFNYIYIHFIYVRVYINLTIRNVRFRKSITINLRFLETK